MNTLKYSKTFGSFFILAWVVEDHVSCRIALSILLKYVFTIQAKMMKSFSSNSISLVLSYCDKKHSKLFFHSYIHCITYHSLHPQQVTKILKNTLSHPVNLSTIIYLTWYCWIQQSSNICLTFSTINSFNW